MEPQSVREEWEGWRGSRPPTTTQESGYGSLGWRDSETECCESLEEATQSTGPAVVVSQLTQTVSWRSNCKNTPIIFPLQDDNNQHKAEDVFRLSQEISSLRQEIVRGDRQIKELEEQVTDVHLINGDV